MRSIETRVVRENGFYYPQVSGWLHWEYIAPSGGVPKGFLTIEEAIDYVKENYQRLDVVWAGEIYVEN